MGSPQGLSPWLDPTAGPHRMFPCLALVLSPMSMTHPHGCSPHLAHLPGPPLWSPRVFPLSGLHTRSQGCSGVLVSVAGPHTWAHSHTPEQVPRPCPHPGSSQLDPIPGPHPWSSFLSPHLFPSLLPTRAGLCRQHHWEPRGHPRCHRATPRLAIPIQGG